VRRGPVIDMIYINFLHKIGLIIFLTIMVDLMAQLKPIQLSLVIISADTQIESAFETAILESLYSYGYSQKFVHINNDNRVLENPFLFY
jgi:hypothetical protein